MAEGMFGEILGDQDEKPEAGITEALAGVADATGEIEQLLAEWQAEAS